MKIFVINLPNDQERRQFITRQLRELMLDHEMMPGVYGKALSDEELTRSYNNQRCLRIQCRPLVPAEIGCALSHIAVYRAVIERNLPYALILEDDVRLPKELPSVINALERRLDPARPQVVLLSQATLSEKGATSLVLHYRVASFKKGVFAHAYVVTRSAARALSRFLYPVSDVADCWARLSQYRVVDIEGVTPAVIAQDQIAFGSSTTTDPERAEARRNGIGPRLAFKSRRAFWLGIDWLSARYHRRLEPIGGLSDTEDEQRMH